MRLLYLALVLVATGCSSLLPTEVKRTKNVWQSFAEAQATFDKIVPHQTTAEDLNRLGMDPQITPNVRVLTYLDVIERFVPNASISLNDLQEDVKDCIVSKDCCRAYELSLDFTDSERFGSVLMDVFGFRKKTHTTGWNFKGLVIVKDDLVVYKIRSGQPNVDKLDQKSKPLGPFQELDNVLMKIPKL